MRRDIGQINIKLDKDFRKQANKLIRKYGDKMAELNGFAGKQLGYTEFIDNFVDKQTVADASIDGNANVGTKDICSLLSEMNKPHSKLLAFNKIYYELKKKYGKQEANKWLQDEWVGRSYMHDAYSSSTKPYCFSGDTEILTKSGIVKLKDAVGKDIRVLNKNGVWEAATVKHFGRDVLWKLTLERYGVVKEIYTTQNHKWFVGGRTERDLVQTTDLVRGMRIPCNVSVAPTKVQEGHEAWIVRSVECTNVVDDVYCAVAEKTHSFTLDGNVLTHNCYAYDIDPLVNKGLFFVDRFNAQPPKHLTTFTDFVGEFVSYTSNRTSGACGLPSFLIYSFYFWKKDCESGYCISNPEYYRDQEFQRIIYKLNQPYLRVNQSAFTNFSIFDRPYLEALFGGKEYPDGSFIIDYIDDLIDYQKHFMEIVSKIRTENVMTFPVKVIAA